MNEAPSGASLRVYGEVVDDATQPFPVDDDGSQWWPEDDPPPREPSGPHRSYIVLLVLGLFLIGALTGSIIALANKDDAPRRAPVTTSSSTTSTSTTSTSTSTTSTTVPPTTTTTRSPATTTSSTVPPSTTSTSQPPPST